MDFIADNYQKIKSVLGLSFSLAKANFKVRNEGSYLGIFWYLLEPLFFFIVLIVIRESISDTNIENYQLYLIIGLIMFNFFTAVTNFSTKVIQNNASFIKSLKINKESFVFSGVLQYVFSHFFEFLILTVFVLFLKVEIIWILLFYPIIFFMFCLFTTGVSLVLSVIGVYINDLKNVWSVFTRLLWFITPIFYVIENNGLLHRISMLNPLYHFINISRDMIIYHKTPQFSTIFLAIFFSVLVFLIGLLIFERNKSKLAEKI